MIEPIHIQYLQGCARCGSEGHENLTFLPLKFPIEIPEDITGGRSIAFSHWTPCPVNGEPILMMWFSGEEAPADPTEGWSFTESEKEALQGRIVGLETAVLLLATRVASIHLGGWAPNERVVEELIQEAREQHPFEEE